MDAKSALNVKSGGGKSSVVKGSGKARVLAGGVKENNVSARKIGSGKYDLRGGRKM